jgi:hypothetical protein
MREIILKKEVQVKKYNISFCIQRPVFAGCDDAGGHYDQCIFSGFEFIDAGQEIYTPLLQKTNPVVGPSVWRDRSLRVGENMFDPLNLVVEFVRKF